MKLKASIPLTIVEQRVLSVVHDRVGKLVSVQVGMFSETGIALYRGNLELRAYSPPEVGIPAIGGVCQRLIFNPDAEYVGNIFKFEEFVSEVAYKNARNVMRSVEDDEEEKRELEKLGVQDGWLFASLV